MSAAFSGPISLVAMSDDRLQDWEREAINSYLSWEGGKGPIPYVNRPPKVTERATARQTPRGRKARACAKEARATASMAKTLKVRRRLALALL